MKGNDMSSSATDYFDGIEQFEAGLWKIADDLRANSGLASNEQEKRGRRHLRTTPILKCHRPLFGTFLVQQAPGGNLMPAGRVLPAPSKHEVPEKNQTAVDRG